MLTSWLVPGVHPRRLFDDFDRDLLLVLLLAADDPTVGARPQNFTCQVRNAFIARTVGLIYWHSEKLAILGSIASYNRTDSVFWITLSPTRKSVFVVEALRHLLSQGSPRLFLSRPGI